MITEYNDILYEYNLINNIPLLHPLNIHDNIFFYKKHDIATPDIVLNFLKNELYDNKNIFEIRNKSFKYIKINLNKKYKNNIEALYCYLIIDNYIYIKNLHILNKININSLDINVLIQFLITNDFNNYFIITCPIFKCNNIYYSITNDNNIPSIIKINKDVNEVNIINLLIYENCYTICDNYILIISLFQKNIINKKSFINIIRILNTYYKYTENTWIYLMNKHTIFSVCDYPYFYLARTPYKITKDIMELFDELKFNNIYIQSPYKNNTCLFTSLISNSYPYTDKNFILNNNIEISNSLWKNNNTIDINYSELYSKNNILYIPDLFGLFASISSVNSMWKYWIENKSILLNTILNSLNNKYKYTIIEVLNSLFELYNNGYDTRNIKKNKIRKIWIDALDFLDPSKKILPEILNIILLNINNKKLYNVPYIFLKNIFEIYNINFFENKLYISDIKYGCYIYKKTSLYNIYNNHSQIYIKNNIYYFNKNIVKNKLIYIFMCIYRKFNMFKNDKIDNYNYRIGEIIMNYIKNDIKKIL